MTILLYSGVKYISSVLANIAKQLAYIFDRPPEMSLFKHNRVLRKRYFRLLVNDQRKLVVLVSGTYVDVVL